MTDLSPDIQKRATSQHLRYLREVFGLPTIEAVVARLAADAYQCAPSRAQLDLQQAGLVRFQVVIAPHIYTLLTQMKVNLRHKSNIQTVLHLIELASNEFDTPCRTCVHEIMLKRGQRGSAVMGQMTHAELERWNVLRSRMAATNTHGRTKAETLERLIAEAWVRAYKPPHTHDRKDRVRAG